MFILTFIPGGRVGIDCIKNTLKSPFTKLFINKAKTEISEMQKYNDINKLYLIKDLLFNDDNNKIIRIIFMLFIFL